VKAAIVASWLCLLAATPAGAGDLHLHGALEQGGLVEGTAAPGTTLAIDGKNLALAPDGSFVFGFGRDAKTATLAITWPDGKRETRTLSIAPRKWRVQRIDGLPAREVTPSSADLARIGAESALLRAARHRATRAAWFRGGFVWPTVGRISGVYGSQRILNGEPRQPHLGVDIAARAGTAVVAAADGVVSLVHGGMFFTGKTVAIDHGLGISTIYAHLGTVLVKPGERVERGQEIGGVGSTGRATGPNLHWGLNWFDVRLDPSLAVGSKPVRLGDSVGKPAARASGLRPASVQP
jgi:murein DD-endopeptidase MepM/ murein hydrolase activator NlpD